MIVDNIENASRYFDTHSYFEEAFEFIRNFDGTITDKQKVSLSGQDLIAIIEPSDSKGRTGARLEAHKKYIDIQYCVEGDEEIGWTPLNECQTVTHPHCHEKDIAFFADVPKLWIPLKSGTFAVFFPEDAHAPLAGSGKVKKIIMKIAVQTPESSSK